MQAIPHPVDRDDFHVQEMSNLDRIISEHFGDRGIPTLNMERLDRKLSERYTALVKAQTETQTQAACEGDETLSTRDFEIACRLIHDCRHVEIGRSDLIFSRAPTPDIGRRRFILERVQIISHLLQHRRYRSEVTAISCIFEPSTTPPRLKVVFAKNKTLTPDDLKRADSIVELVKQNAAADWDVFRDKVLEYLVTHSAAKFGWIFRQALLSYRDLAIYIEKTVRAREIPDSWLSDCSGSVGDGFLHAAVDQTGQPGTYALRSALFALVMTANRSQLQITRSDLCIICCYAYHLRRSLLLRMLLNQIEEETMRRHAEIVVKNLETLGEYFQGTQALWQLFRGDSRLRAALPSFELVPLQDLEAKEIEQMSNTLGIHSLDISEQPADGGEESSLKESLGFIERRAQPFGGAECLAEEWLELFPSLQHGRTSASNSLAAEIKVALYLLKTGHKGILDIGMSDSPSIMSKYWFESLNETLKRAGTECQIPHESARVGCIPWILPGISMVDKRMKQRVLRHVDIIIQKLCDDKHSTWMNVLKRP